MSILAIDTATQVSSVAVASVDKLAAELTMQAKLTHSETLMPHIKEVLRMANVRKENLEGIAVSIGPGSFTGLRIGLAAAKAMAYALNLHIVGVSTLKALFQGRRDLFKGLAIDASDYDWKAYPVIHLDMGSTQCDTAEQFEIVLHDLLDGQARANGVELPRGDLSPARRFARLLEILAERSKRGKVVILVDEYDKPMLHKLGTPEVRPFRDALKRFYSVIKTCEGLQRFALVTGISKFSKVSIFSDLNNLTDITMMPRYATLLGYTRAEVEANFSEHVAELGRGLGLSPEEAMARIVHWYDGYRFEEGAERVINPVSLGLCFQNGRFRNYWSSTAVPTFLVDLLEKRPIDLQGATLSEDELDAYEPERLNVKTLLYQTGYLTIAGVRPRGEGRSYVLDFPNAEVRNSFNTRLARAKDYAARVALRGKPVTLLGVSFDSARRTVAEWKAEPARGV